MPSQSSDFDLIKGLLLDEMVKRIPVGPHWFSQAAIDTGDTGKLLGALSEGIASWVIAIKLSRRGLLLGTAVAEDLDRWGADLALTRKPEENDNNYRARLRKELLRSKVTKNAIKLYVEDVTGLKTDVFQPWQRQDTRSTRSPGNTSAVDMIYGRSGQVHRTSTYYQGGVVDVITSDYHPLTQETTLEAVAAGVRPYFTVLVGTDPVPLSFGEALLTGNEVVVDSVTMALAPQPNYSRSNTRDARSGLVTNSNSTDLISNLFVDLTSGTIQLNSVAHVVDLYPPIRSVFQQEMSPRSGAYGEIGYPEGVDFFLYGNNTVPDWVKINENQVDLSSEHASAVEFQPTTTRSGNTQARSGKKRHSEDSQLESGVLANLLFNTSTQQPDEFFRIEKFPPVRSFWASELSPRSGMPGDLVIIIERPLQYADTYVEPVVGLGHNSEREVDYITMAPLRVVVEHVTNRRSVTKRSGGVAYHSGDLIESEEPMGTDNLGTTQEQAEQRTYDLVPYERSGYYLPFSTRSGAPNEPAPMSESTLYGGVAVTSSFATYAAEGEVHVEAGEVPQLAWYNILSVDRWRSGWPGYYETLVDLENTGNEKVIVYDDPERTTGGHASYTIYESPVTWDAVGAATWDEINIDGHSVQLSSDVLIEQDP